MKLFLPFQLGISVLPSTELNHLVPQQTFFIYVYLIFPFKPTHAHIHTQSSDGKKSAL